MRFSCPSCSQSMQCSDGAAGKKVICPTCGQKVLVPTPPPASPATNKTTLGIVEVNTTTDAPTQDSVSTSPIPPPAVPSSSSSKKGHENAAGQSGNEGTPDDPQTKLVNAAIDFLARDWRRLPTSPLSWLAFLLFFFPWINISCDGRHLASQSGLQTCYGGVTADQRLDRLGNAGGPGARGDKPADLEPWSLLSIIYILLITVAGFLSLACVVAVCLRHSIIATTSHLFSLALTTVASFTLALQMIMGFPIERKFNDDLAKERQRINDRRALAFGEFNQGPNLDPGLAGLGGAMIEFRYSPWLFLSCLITFLSLPILLGESGFLAYRYYKHGTPWPADSG